ncbi:hypothetical protein K502DRAFT_351724 [Neoconidiobolus thromboides FSU 785]|nr:hypothetical protein K502DRAFT_351724 [Neoconidiobolus thromboides FSU 785]
MLYFCPKDFYLLLSLFLFTFLLALDPIISGSSCAIMNEKMYVTGGLKNNLQNNGLYIIELNQKFNTYDFKLNDTSLVQTSTLPSTTTSFSAIFGEGQNGNKLWVYGLQGLQYYDLQSGGITKNNKMLSPPIRSNFAWITHNGYFCMFGGRILETNELTNEYKKFNLTDQKWYTMPSDSRLKKLEYHQGVLANGKFIILGGIDESGDLRDLSEIYVFDISKLQWNVQTTINGEIYKGVKFTPISYKNYIIIQGGSNTLNSSDPNYKLYNNMMVLNLDTWEWREYELSLDTYGNNYFARASYSAWLIGNQLVQFLGEKDSLAPQVQIVNLDTFMAAKEYIPPPKSFYTKAYLGDYSNNTNGNNTLNNNVNTSLPLVIGLSIGGIVLVGLVLSVLVYWFKVKKRRSKRDSKGIREKSEPFLEPIQPNFNFIWSENDGTNVNFSPNSTARNSRMNSK